MAKLENGPIDMEDIKDVLTRLGFSRGIVRGCLVLRAPQGRDAFRHEIVFHCGERAFCFLRFANGKYSTPPEHAILDNYKHMNSGILRKWIYIKKNLKGYDYRMMTKEELDKI